MADADAISKSELAKQLKLSRARISQYVALGLPCRQDGKLNRSEALAWVRANRFPWQAGWPLRGKGGRRRGKDFFDLDPSSDPTVAAAELDKLEDELRRRSGEFAASRAGRPVSQAE